MISKWVLKAIVQKTISYFPWPEKINFFFQKYVTKGVELTDEHFGYKIQHAIDHVAYLQKHSKRQKENIVLELGTGWYPVVPIIFYLTDAGRVISIDIKQWMNKERQFQAIQKLVEWRNRGKLEELDKFINN